MVRFARNKVVDMRTRLLVWLFPVLLLTSLESYAQNGLFTFSCSGPLVRTIVQGLNNRGDLVGQCNATSFWYSDGVINYLEGFYANGINNLEQIVGWNSNNQGYLYENGTYTAIDYPGSDSTVAFGINDAGVIVGDYQVSGQQHGFVYNNGVYTTLDYPGAVSTGLSGINNSGAIVGYFCTSPCQSSHGFLYNESTFTQIDYPGAQGTAVYAINNTGILVGGYDNAAFIDDNGVFSSVDYMHSSDTALWGVNDRGEVVGYWVDGHQAFHGLQGYFSRP
jgi:hypothetical protein